MKNSRFSIFAQWLFVDFFRCAHIYQHQCASVSESHTHACLCFQWFAQLFCTKFLAKSLRRRHIVAPHSIPISCEMWTEFFDFWAAFYGFMVMWCLHCHWLFELLLFNQNGFFERISQYSLLYHWHFNVRSLKLIYFYVCWFLSLVSFVIDMVQFSNDFSSKIGQDFVQINHSFANKPITSIHLNK